MTERAPSRNEVFSVLRVQHDWTRREECVILKGATLKNTT